MSLEPRVVPGRLVHELTSLTERLDWTSLFPSRQPIEIELGAGDGSFLLAHALANRARNFLGVERLKGRLSKIDRKGQRAGLTNLRAIRVEAAYLLEYLVPAASAAVLHVYFPDPWPKQRHRARRLVGPRFPALAAAALEPRGLVYLRTDDADYFAQMESVFGAEEGFERDRTPAALAAVTTDFEREFNARGIPTLYSAWRKTA